jgi:hypothetical protein
VINNDLKNQLNDEAEVSRKESDRAMRIAMAANARADTAEQRLREAEERFMQTLKISLANKPVRVNLKADTTGTIKLNN